MTMSNMSRPTKSGIGKSAEVSESVNVTLERWLDVVIESMLLNLSPPLAANIATLGDPSGW